jgi:hypothetical protein
MAAQKVCSLPLRIVVILASQVDGGPNVPILHQVRAIPRHSGSSGGTILGNYETSWEVPANPDRAALRAVKAKGASLKAIEPPIDTSTAASKCFLDISACSRNLRPICDASDSLKELPTQGAQRLQGPQAER